MPTRLQIARKDIIREIEAAGQIVLRHSDLEGLLSQNRDQWRLAQRTTVNEFIRYLRSSSKLRRVDLPFPHRKEIRYTWGEVDLLEVLLTLKPHCHFSHYSAMAMHELTEQDPKTIYVNHEQPAKPISGASLTQHQIDVAFKRRPRITSNVATVDGQRVFLLNGKNTGYLGVEVRRVGRGKSPATIEARVTDIERTLIDIAVRPFYAGGVAEVLKAYRAAADRASTNRLAALLRQLDYVYPYHQAIGFYLERSGAYAAHAIELFRSKFEITHDFYLDYQLKLPRHDSSWRIFVPQGL